MRTPDHSRPARRHTGPQAVPMEESSGGLTRRSLLKGAAGLLGLGALAHVAGWVSLGKGENRSETPQSAQPSPPVSPTAESKQTPLAPYQTPEYQRLFAAPLLDSLSQNYTPEEASLARAKRDQEVSLVENQYNHQARAANTLRWKDLIQKLVSDPRVKIKPEDRDKEIRVALGTILIESSGFEYWEAGKHPNYYLKNPKALWEKDNPDKKIEQGLMQIKREVAEPIAKELGLQDDFQLKDPETNILIYLKHRQKLKENFGELADILHNWGNGRAIRAISLYETKIRGTSPEMVDRILEDRAKSGARVLIDRSRLNPVRLIEGLLHLRQLPDTRDAVYRTGLEDTNLSYFYMLIGGEEVIRRTVQSIEPDKKAA